MYVRGKLKGPDTLIRILQKIQNPNGIFVSVRPLKIVSDYERFNKD